MSKEITIEDLGIEESAGFKNMIAIRDYTKATRTLFRELKKETELYKKQVHQQGQAIELLRKQMTELLIKVHSNKTTG